MDYGDLSLKQAAEVAGVSVATLRRKRARLQEVGAVCEPGGWHVSTVHLAAVGLLDQSAQKTRLEPVNERLRDSVERELEALRERVVEAEKRAAVAEAVAAARLEVIETQRQVLRLLEAAPSSASQASKEASAREEPDAAPRASAPAPQARRWWGWIRRR